MTVNRRDFLAASATGAALLIGIGGTGCGPRTGSPALSPNQWLRIDADGRVTFFNDKSEMGQGAGTAVPMILAEELGVRLDQVTVLQAEPGPRFPDMGTAGSDSVAGRWDPVREAAAAAREMLIAAAALQWRVPAAECITENGTVRHLATQREIGFGGLVAAAARLPVPAKPTLKPASRYRLVGTRVPRLDSGAVVTGTKVYGLDQRVPGALHAVLARCPAPGGKLVRWSGERAKRVPGVRQVVAVSNGVAVVADTTWAALEGRKALDVEWDERATHGIDSAALWERLGAGFGRDDKEARREGDPPRAMAGAARRIEAEYRYPFQAPAAIEPLNATADVRTDGCEIWCGTQNANRAQQEVATLLGLSPEKVRIHVLTLGGAFGRRISADFVVEAVEVSRAVKAPVQLVWSREDDFAHDMYQSAAIVRMEAGLDRAGRIVAWSHRVADFHLSMFGAFDPATFKPAEELEPWGGFDTPYHFPALDVRIARQPPPVRTGAWRSVFYPSGLLARESFLDEIAAATGRDPLELRLELLAPPKGQDGPDRQARLRAVLGLAAEQGGWREPLPDHGPGRRVGRGIACNVYHRRTVVAHLAEVSVDPAGAVTIHRLVCAMDCGRPVNLDGIEAQIQGAAAWALSTLSGREITFKDGRTEQSTFADFPVLRIGQMPKVEVHIVPSDLPPSGVGEQPVPAVIPAVLNAIFRATGRRIRRVPLDPPQR